MNRKLFVHRAMGHRARVTRARIGRRSLAAKSYQPINAARRLRATFDSRRGAGAEPTIKGNQQ